MKTPRNNNCYLIPDVHEYACKGDEKHCKWCDASISRGRCKWKKEDFDRSHFFPIVGTWWYECSCPSAIAEVDENRLTAKLEEL